MRTFLISAGAALVITGCSETGAPELTSGRSRVLFAVAGALSGEVLEISSWYVRSDQTVVPLGTTELALEEGNSQTVSTEIDIAGCLADELREGTGAGCPIRLRLELRDAAGEVVDTSSIGPLDAEPDEVLSPPAVTLRHVESIVLGIVSPTLLIGTTGSVNAQVRDRLGTVVNGRTLVWSSNNPSVATVDQSGTVTPVSAGQVTVRATLDGRTTGPEGTLLLTIVPLASVTVSPPSATIDRGAQVQLTATIAPGFAPQTVTWTTADPTVATVDNTGKVTGMGRGTTTITARSTHDPSKSGGSAITVRGVISIAIAPTVDSVRVGGTSQFLTTVLADPGVSTAAFYSSLNSAVATVNQATGLATAVSRGVTTIRTTAAADVTKVADATLHVVSACALPIVTTIGQTVNAAVNASSCGDSQFASEQIMYPGNSSSPAILVSGTADFSFHFGPIAVPRGSFFFRGDPPTVISAQVWAGAGNFRSYIGNAIATQFGNASWTTSSIAGRCGYVMSATNVVVGPFPFTNACAVGPAGPALVPSGVYYGIWMDLLPPLAVGEGYTIQATTDGFPPRIVLWHDANSSVQYEAIGSGTSATLNYVAATVSDAGYHRAIVTSATPGLTGNITISISGPNAAAMSLDDAAAAVLHGAPGATARPAGPAGPPVRR